MNSIHGYTKPFSCVPKKFIPKKDIPGKEQNEIIKDSKILIEFLGKLFLISYESFYFSN